MPDYICINPDYICKSGNTMPESEFQIRRNISRNAIETSWVDHKFNSRAEVVDLQFYGFVESTVRCGGKVYPSSAVSRLHFYWGLEFVTAGEGVVTVNGKKYPLRKDDFLCCRPGLDLCIAASRHTALEKLSLLVANDLLMEYFFSFAMLPDSDPVIHITDSARLRAFYAQIRMMADEGRGEHLRRDISSLIFSCIAEIKRHVHPYNNLDRFDQIIFAISRLPQSFRSVRELSHAFKISEPALFRLFKKRFACSPMRFVIRQRLQNSAWQLTQKNTLVKEIASMYGYNDPDFFAREFRKEFGITPHAFQQIETQEQLTKYIYPATRRNPAYLNVPHS